MKKEETAIVVADPSICDECQKKCKNAVGVIMHKSKVHRARVIKKSERKTSEKVVVSEVIEEFPLELIAYTVGKLESDIHRVAFENGIPAKHFAKRCAEYLLHSARR
jgi:hypothetical protein